MRSASVLAEEIGEFHKFLGVPGKAGELGKHEAGDVAALQCPASSAWPRVLHDGFAGYAGQVIHLDHRPAVELGVLAGALFVMFRAFALGLVLGRNPDPDAHSLLQGAIFLLTLFHNRKHRPIARKKRS